MSSKKKRIHMFFRAEHCAKKNVDSKKKGTHIFFVPRIVPKKWVPKKNVCSKKKELKLKFSFFEPNIVPEKNMTAQKRMRSEKKKELILFRAKHCAKKRNSYF